jgi:hypothetical protein
VVADEYEDGHCGSLEAGLYEHASESAESVDAGLFVPHAARASTTKRKRAMGAVRLGSYAPSFGRSRVDG